MKRPAKKDAKILTVPRAKLGPVKLNGKILTSATAATTKLHANALAAAIPSALAPPRLDLPTPKALPAPAKPPALESPKDVTWLSMRRDVLQACLLVTAKRDGRAALEGVYLHSLKGELRAVATNGHTLLLHSSQPKVVPDWLDVGLILPREGLKLALSAIEKIDGGDSGVVNIGWARGHGYAIVRDGEELATFRLRRIDARFADYQKVIEDAGQVLAGGERQPLTSTSFDGEYVKQAAAIGHCFGAKGLTPFAGSDSKAPVVITFFGEPGALFVIMPLISSSAEQLPTQTMALIGRGLEGTLAALKASQTRQKKQLADSKSDSEKKSLEAAIALRDERITSVLLAIKGKLLEAPKAA